jgi:Abortive infection bacteriophage resistance protein
MYNKAAFTIDEQIAQLTARGLEINEEDNCEHFLTHISYYRLAGYWWPMQADKEQHILSPTVNSRMLLTYTTLIESYEFCYLMSLKKLK